MTTAGYQWSLSNNGPERLLVWLEPWCDEFEIPIHSTITFKAFGAFEERGIGEAEWTPDTLIIWGNGAMFEVFIDGVRQDSGSATIPVPDGLTKEMLNIIFADQPSARLGGTLSNRSDRPSLSLWQRVKRFVGI